MRRLLCVAYHFPPIGYSGVQRTVKFIRYLEDFGWRTTVVAGPQASEEGLLPLDRTLADEIPADTTVLRVTRPEPSPSTGNRARAERWLRMPRPWSRWWVDEVAAVGAQAARDADVLFCSMSPFESATATARLAARSGRPWVADLRDPWALDEMLVFPTWLHRRAELRVMRRALSSASAIVMNTPDAARALASEFPEMDGRVHAITNGFDATDFAGPPPVRDDGFFRIVHTGSFHTDAGMQRRTMRVRRLTGGTIGGVDFLTRSHVFLVQAVSRLVEREPGLASRIRLVFAGISSPADQAHTAPFVEFVPYLPHGESVALMRGADMLFLPMHDVHPGRRVRIVPGKTYEYLAAGPPILAAVPQGDARTLIREAGAGYVCDPSDVECMARTIREAVRRADAGEAPPHADPEVIARYERRELTRRLALVLEGALGTGGRPST